jgi:hypothetical protein
MNTWIVSVTETRHHAYEVQAETEEEAIEIYDAYGAYELAEHDIDGSTYWDSPWEVREVTK